MEIFNSTDLQDGFRDENGRFMKGGPGGPGRPRGCSNQATANAKRIRQEWLETWDEVDGRELLRKLAKENPAEYLRLSIKILPRESEVIVNPELDERDLIRVETVIQECLMMAEEEETGQYLPERPSVLPVEQEIRGGLELL